MGFLPLSLTLLLAATPIAVQEPPLQDKAAPVLEQAMAPEAFEAVLLEGDILRCSWRVLMPFSSGCRSVCGCFAIV